MFMSARFIDLCYVLTILSTLSMSTDGIRQMRLAEMRNRMISRRLATLEENAAKVCFDMLGCFVDRQSPPVKRAPQHPNVIKTQFFLYTRSERKNPEAIKYGDNFESIKQSKFNVSNPLKIIVHGYKGSGNDTGAIKGAQALLDVENANVVIVDWARGANGSYSIAVSNVELVGRQLALIILDAIKLGIDPNAVHIFGFSLGAHIAGCTSEMLKKRNILLGRITGLDPASPFFRNRIFRERSRKLDVSDAKLVDVIHTDGSIDFADGFGLFKPIGHVDFFPNGGREQPGCTDVKNAVVVSHLNEELLDRDIACSHLRAWALFVESVVTQLQSGCKFISWPCPQGAASFTDGSCFPPETEKWSQEMGYAADRGPLGIYYVVTRHEAPFCGDPLRIAVKTLDNAPPTRGVLFLKIQRDNSTATFQVRCDLPHEDNGPLRFYGLVATEFRAFVDLSRKIEGLLWYQPKQNDTKDNDTTIDQISPVLFLNSLFIEDRKGNRWNFCRTSIEVDSSKQFVTLQSEECWNS